MSYDVGTGAHSGQAEAGCFVDSKEILSLRGVLLGFSGLATLTLIEIKM